MSDLNELCYIWGTGSLCERYLALQPKAESLTTAYVDSSRSGEFRGKTLLTPSQLPVSEQVNIIICSTYYSEIAEQCLSLGFTTPQITVVLPRNLQAVALADMFKFAEQAYYHLPWTQQMDQIQSALSNDIMFPDVYKALTKAVAYCFVGSVAGDLAEFGTCSGYSASLIAHVLDYYTQHLAEHEDRHGSGSRQLHLFDSFQGFPKATEQADLDAPHVASGAWGEGTAKGLSEAQLRQLCQHFLPEQRIQTYAGWYKDTLSDIAPDTRFAFVHMDCDLYESTYQVLDYLLANKHLSQGATLMFDNWFCNQASPEFCEQKAWRDICAQYDIQYTDIGMYACVGNRFIIHSYQPRTPS